MRIGSALALLAVGLILATAVDADVPGLDLQTLGNIIALVGILGLVVTLGLEYAAHRSRRPPREAPRRAGSAPRHVASSRSSTRSCASRGGRSPRRRWTRPTSRPGSTPAASSTRRAA